MDTILKLPSELTIYVVGELRGPWLAWLDEAVRSGGEAAADGQAVQEVDAAGVQMLLALARSLQARGQLLGVTQPSEALQQACRWLGAAHLLVQQPAGAPA